MIPQSFIKAGYSTIKSVRKKRRLMIGTEGLTNTGKTEFLLSCPGPGIVIALDRGFDSMLDNPNPPAWRNEDNFVFDVIPVPKQGTAKQDVYVEYFRKFRDNLYAALDNPDALTVATDGDSDSWELQLLAEFGKVSQIPPMAYQMVDAVRRAIVSRCWDSGKIIIATNKLKDKYEDLLDEEGNQIIDDKSGKPKQRKVSGEYKRQGFRDQDYLWQIQIRHLYKPVEKKIITAGPRKGQVLGTTLPQWGIRIMKCKANPMLEGDELWGDKCNFRELVSYIYPHVNPIEWGFKE